MGLFLFQLLANIVQGYFSQQKRKKEEYEQKQQNEVASSDGDGTAIDRRKYQGKYKNSPMLIKLIGSK